VLEESHQSKPAADHQSPKASSEVYRETERHSGRQTGQDNKSFGRVTEMSDVDNRAEETLR
jgi:hypothetical protein